MKLVSIYQWVFDDVEFGIRLRDFRVAAGLDQKQVAALLGVTSSYVSAMERGRITDGIPVRIIVRASNLMEIEPGMFFALQRVASPRNE